MAGYVHQSYINLSGEMPVESDREPRAALPRYIQITERLIRDIDAGRLHDGARLPPERALAEELGVAVGTLRKALDELTRKGLVERIHGSGNYIRHKPGVESVYGFFRLERPDGGGLPTAEVLDVARLPKPVGAPPFGPSDAAFRIRRLRRLDGVAAALEEIWLDGDQADSIAPEDLSESLYLYYRDDLALIIGRTEDRVGLDSCPDWGGPDFPVPPGRPLPFIERRSWSDRGDIVEYSRTWFDNEGARYISRLGKG